MRQGGAAPVRDPATIGLAAAPPSNRNLNNVQSTRSRQTRPPSSRCSAWSIDRSATCRLPRLSGRSSATPAAGATCDGPLGMPSSQRALLVARRSVPRSWKPRARPSTSTNFCVLSPTAGRPTSATLPARIGNAGWPGAPLPCAVHLFQRIRHHRGQEGAGVVRPGREPGLWTNWTSVRKGAAAGPTGHAAAIPYSLRPPWTRSGGHCPAPCR